MAGILLMLRYPAIKEWAAGVDAIWEAQPKGYGLSFSGVRNLALAIAAGIAAPYQDVPRSA